VGVYIIFWLPVDGVGGVYVMVVYGGDVI